jgi:hypothetical protein
LRRTVGAVVGSLVGLLLSWTVAATSFAADHLLLTEFAVTPTDGEFIEIYNPTGDFIDLSEYYVSDFVLSSVQSQNYWRIVNGTLVPDPAFPNDFLAKFPDGSTIAPGQTIVISLHDDAAFSAEWSTDQRVVSADFELVDDGESDGVPAMIDPGPALVGVPLIQSAAGLSNAREVIVLFRWDGQSDLVQDIDIVQWSDAGPVFNTVSPNKTGQAFDGPDADTTPTPYLPDTAPALQDLAHPGQHDFGLTVSRVDFNEGAETQTGGNGVLGHDETSENYSLTWQGNTIPSIGSPGEFGPPSVLAAAGRASDTVEILFSRAMDPESAETVPNYNLARVTSPGGEIGVVPLQVLDVQLGASGTSAFVKTVRQIPGALYEARVSNVLSEDLSSAIVGGTRVFFRAFSAEPGVRLEVPHRPFVPQLDREIEISYQAPQGTPILLRVFDTRGRERFVMADENAPPGGLRTIRWDGRDDLRQRLPAGLYVLHLEATASGDHTTAPLVVATSSEETLR